MCFLFKDIMEVRKKLLKNRERGITYVSKDCDYELLAKETVERVRQHLKDREKGKEKIEWVG